MLFPLSELLFSTMCSHANPRLLQNHSQASTQNTWQPICLYMDMTCFPLHTDLSILPANGA